MRPEEEGFTTNHTNHTNKESRRRRRERREGTTRFGLDPVPPAFCLLFV
jgi:hypothetical protein